MLTLCYVACLWCAAGEKAQKKLKKEASTMLPLQVDFGSFLSGLARTEPPLERRPLLASNSTVAAMMPMSMAGGGAWPLAAEARMQSAARAPVLACAVRAP